MRAPRVVVAAGSVAVLAVGCAESPSIGTPCKNHIETLSADVWARELGQSETWVLANHRIALWEGPQPSKGRKVGELRVGSRAVILEERADDYRVRSPLDQSTGWLGKIQVARTLYQDEKTFQPCDPK